MNAHRVGFITLTLVMVTLLVVSEHHSHAQTTAPGGAAATGTPTMIAGPAQAAARADSAEDIESGSSAEGSSEQPPPPAPSGTILARDDFTDPTAGLLPQVSLQPGNWQVGYGNGEYRIASVGSTARSRAVLVRGNYADIAIAVDARLVLGSDSAPDPNVSVGCRLQLSDSSLTGYRFFFSPLQNKWGLARADGSTSVTLTGVHFLTSVPVGAAMHRVQLTCSGTTISASIDGTQVVSVQDASYTVGQTAVGTGMFTAPGSPANLSAGFVYPGTLDARFKNLVLSQP